MNTSLRRYRLKHLIGLSFRFLNVYYKITETKRWVHEFNYVIQFIHPSINDSRALCWALAAFLISWSFTQSVWLFARRISTSQGLYLTQTQNKRTQTSMNWVGFERTIPAFERKETLHALDRAATVIVTLFNAALISEMFMILMFLLFSDNIDCVLNKCQGLGKKRSSIWSTRARSKVTAAITMKHCLLEFGAAWFGSLPTFQRKVPSPSSKFTRRSIKQAELMILV
jgi:hypothetical protein